MCSPAQFYDTNFVHAAQKAAPEKRDRFDYKKREFLTDIVNDERDGFSKFELRTRSWN